MHDTITDENQVSTEKFAFSFSSMSMLFDDIKKFHKSYIQGDKDILDFKYLKEGQLLHCLTLEPHMLSENFVIMSASLPDGKGKDVIDEMFRLYGLMEEPDDSLRLSDFSDQILSYMKEIDYYQALTDDKRNNADGVMLTGDSKRLAKILTREAEQYFNTLKEGLSKTVVDLDMLNRMQEKANAIIEYDRNNKNLLSITSDDETLEEIRYELELKAVLENQKYFDIKGILDCVKIDHVNKIIYITDLKTTSKKLKNFKESVEMYMYWLQAVFYKKLIESLLSGDTYEIVIHFLVVDKTNSVYAFRVSEKSLAKWEEDSVELFAKASWHMQFQEWNLPYEYAKNLVEL
jgi:hypothetical protein